MISIYQVAMMRDEALPRGIGDELIYEKRLRAMTHMLVRRHRQKIEQLAMELLKRRSMGRREIDRLFRRMLSTEERQRARRIYRLRRRYIFEALSGPPLLPVSPDQRKWNRSTPYCWAG